MPVKDKKPQWRSEVLAYLQETAADIIAGLDLQTILQKAVNRTAELIGADIVTVHIYDPLTGGVRAVAGHGLTDEATFRQHGPGRGKVERLVARRGTPIITEDVSASELAGPFAAREGVQSAAGLPLKVGDEIIGVLFVSYRETHKFKPEEVEVLISLANQAAIAIQNARLLSDAQRRVQDLEIVNSVSQIIGAKLDPQDLLQTIASQIADKLHCTHCTLFFPQKEDGELLLVPQVTHGTRSEVMTRRFRLGEGLAGWVFQHGQSLVPADASEDPRFAPARERRDRPRSMLVAPVKVGDHTIGVISADQDEYGWFSENDRRLVDAVAQQAGIAIQRATGLALLQDIGGRIISLQNVDDILQRVVSGAIKLTNTTSGVIYLVSEDGKSVTRSFQYPTDFDHPAPRMDRERGLTRRVIKTGEVLIFPDILQDTRVNPVLHDRVRSMIAIPLKFEQRVIGVLYLNDAHRHDFTETEVSLLSTLASQAASAVQKARLFEELQERATQLERLQEVTTLITAERSNLGKVLRLIVNSLGDIFPGASCTVRLYSSKTDRFESKVAIGLLADLVERLPRPGGVSRYVIKTKMPRYLVGDTLAKPSDGGPAVRVSVLKQGVKACAHLPLLSEGDVIGVLYVDLTTPHRFSAHEKRILELFAAQAAIAIENARSYETLEEKVEERALQLKKEHKRRLAAESWATLGKTAGNLLHRINNTTGIIPVAVQSLRELLESVQIGEERRKDVVADLDRIERNSRNTLQLARVLWKPFEVTPTKRHDVNALVEEAISSANIPATVHLQKHLGSTLPMIATSHLLTDVFVELITNAVKSMPDGGRLTIVSEKANDDYVAVRFSDTGSGISRKNQEKIFDLFYTTDKSSLGFGLWWVRTFLMSQGGIISINSRKGRGATFTVRLPIEGPGSQVE
jgi:GAF domain-containing protein